MKSDPRPPSSRPADGETSEGKFAWDDGDITWLDADGNEMTKEQVKQVQADARKAEAEAERDPQPRDLNPHKSR